MIKNQNSKFQNSYQKTAKLLISGGDSRLTLNANGINKYGCRPFPDDEILAFSSSTASPISTQGFNIANSLRERLEQANFSADIHAQEIHRQKIQWRELLGLSSDSRLIFSPSGTDLHHLVATQVADNTRIIMVESNETGSGVASALMQGRGVEIVSVSLRLQNGETRSITEIDNEVGELVEQVIKQQREVLLILVDQSKTGIIAPSTNCAISLKKRYESKINVLVDACQFRLAAKTVRAYLAQNFMLAVTGSKFFAAPSFSAMLIVPPAIEFNAEAENINFGLLLRMEIALQQYQAFSALSNTQICAVISNFTQTVTAYLAQSPHFELLDHGNLGRDGLTNFADWDTLPTIFPFLLLRNEQPLSFAQTVAMYQQLPLQNPRCQIGQPVLCGEEKTALRLCLSAPLIVQATQSPAHKQNCIEKALLVLKTLEKCIFNG